MISYVTTMRGFAHVEKDAQLGLVHLDYPRCILWYGSGFGDEHWEWIDQPGINERVQVMHDLESKALELQRDTNSIPIINYNEL